MQNGWGLTLYGVSGGNILPREVRKLAPVNEEKDVALALLTDDLQNCEYENVALQAQRDVYQAELEEFQVPSLILGQVMFLVQEILLRKHYRHFMETYNICQW